MNLDDVWRPNQQENYPEETITKTQTPRRTIRTLSDVLQPDHHSGFTKPSSYYVPPGNNSFCNQRIVMLFPNYLNRKIDG